MGLTNHQMGGFDREKLLETFNIPDNHTPMAMITPGWPGDPDVLPEKIKEQEFGSRNRKPLKENFFFEEWGKGIIHRWQG